MAPKTILITGASGGIGAALARVHARGDVTLLLWGRDGARLETVAAECRTLGAQCVVEALDLRDAAAMTARLAASDDAMPIDLAILNAGLGGMPPKSDVAEMAEASLATAQVNFVAPIVAANSLAGRMARRGGGHIVLVGSVAAWYPLPQAPTYAATKAGLAMFADALAIRLAPCKVAVTLVAPGFIDTAMSRSVPPPKPFLISADKAAVVIARGIAAKRRRIVVPWQFSVIGAVTALLPPAAVALDSVADMTAMADTGWRARLIASPAGRAGIVVLRWGIPLALLIVIGRKLSELGWGEVWRARPGNIGFYLLLVAQFFLQPIGDYCVYRGLWGARHAPPASVILKKRLMNTFLLDYSGEAFFYFWAQRHLGLPSPQVTHGIKDSNLLSGGAGLAMVWILGLILLASGGLHLPQLPGQGWIYALAGTVPLILCAGLVLGHRKVTVLSRRQLMTVFAIHFGRACLVLGVEFALWRLSGALPTAVACLQFVTLRLVITRLPVVPNKDLIFVGAGIAAAGAAHAAVTPVATVLVILAAADLILAAAVAGVTSLIDIRRR